MIKIVSFTTFIALAKINRNQFGISHYGVKINLIRNRMDYEYPCPFAFISMESAKAFADACEEYEGTSVKDVDLLAKILADIAINFTDQITNMEQAGSKLN